MALQGIGLNEKEITVYLTLHKEPVNNIWDLVIKTGLSKSSVYRSFNKLEEMELTEKKGGIISARPLQYLISHLNSKERKLRKGILELKSLSPYLQSNKEPIEVFETFYTLEQIKEAYLFMSEIDYNTNLDFGDFEHFARLLGSVDISMKFRKNRLRHADHHAICSTYGEYTSYFCTRDAAKKFKNKVDLLNIPFIKQFIIFSDNNDYVLFNHFKDQESPYSVLIKSRPIAEAQRAQFLTLSRGFGN